VEATTRLVVEVATSFAETFANYVKSIRRRCDMTEEVFAHTYHLEVSTIRDWEQGLREPRRPPRRC